MHRLSLPHWFSSLHVRTQHLLILLLLSILPLVFVFSFIYSSFYRTLREQTVRDMSNTIDQVVSTFDLVTGRIESTATTLAYTERIQRYFETRDTGGEISHADTFSVEQTLSNFYDRSVMRSICLLDSKGNELQYPGNLSRRTRERVGMYSTDDFKNHTIWDVESSEGLIHVLFPVVSVRNYRRLGYIDISLYADLMKRQFSHLHFGQRGWIVVLDENERMIFGTVDQVPKEVTEALREGTSVAGNYLVFAGAPQIKGWRIVGFISQEAAYWEVGRIMGLFVFILLLIAALALLAARWFSDYSQRHINRLTDAMEKFADGDLTVQVPADSNPEYRLAGEHFNGMVKEINRLIDSQYKAKLVENRLELKMLQAQINPHFLYNTLNVMYWKSISAKQNDLAKMASSLAALFRSSIDRTRTLVPVKEAVERVRDYVFIQQMRYGERMHVIFSIPEAFNDYIIPKLVLQPAVENAFEHGLEPKKGEGTIQVSAVLQDGDLFFSIVDNGVGMNQEQVDLLLKENPEKPYQGLYNVHKRLQLTYGDDYGVRIESQKGTGTKVILKMKAMEVSDVQGSAR